MRRDINEPHRCLALLRNFDIREAVPFGQPVQVRFPQFVIRQIQQNSQELDEAREVFPQAEYGDCIYTREYVEIPGPVLAYGYGQIPVDFEDAVLLLRLYRPGDFVFVQTKIQRLDGSAATQSPYRATSDYVSSRTYELRQADVFEWSRLADLKGTAAWESPWFKVARRFFLYGGAKEFNVEWDEVDRIVDYMIALEAALVPEHLLVGRCLRERAARLINQNDPDTKRFLRDLYNIRSTIAHGSSLSADDKTFLQTNRARVEETIRRVLVESLRQIPEGETERKAFLANLYAPSDDDYVDQARRQFGGIADPGRRLRFLIDLVAEQRYSPLRLLRFLGSVPLRMVKRK